MKALSILIGLLLTSPIYCFDTLSIEPGLQGIKTDANGITVFQYLELPAELGSFVFEINKLPNTLDQDNIKVEEEGFLLINLEWIKSFPKSKSDSYPKLYEQMQSLKDRLKELDQQESESLRFKKELLSKMVDPTDIFSIRELYKEKDIAYKKERIRIYNELQLIQNDIIILKDQLIHSEVDSQGTLYLSIYKEQMDAKILRFNYFLAHPKKGTPSKKDPSKKTDLKQDSQFVKGRVIESSNRIPLIFALVEIYEGEALVHSLYTDEMGIFETKLAANRNYTFQIYQEGYKDRKVKMYHANSDAVNYRTYTMKEKKSFNFMEAAAYTIQAVTLISYNW